jgi:hypothetical protein
MPFAEYESFEDCVAKNQDKADPKAYCGTIQRQTEGDKQRKIGFDTATLDAKILVDDDKYLVMPAVIASEIVHQYEDGWAYKPAEDLEEMAKTANDIGAIPVKILSHPDASTNYLLVKQSDVYGRAENFQYVKNLIDAKTHRPCRKGVRADIRWFKDRTPADIIEQIKTGTMHDVSIGFTFDREDIKGEFEGVKYDYTQRNLFLNHVAAPIQAGRCPGPVCGIGYDSSIVNFGMDDAKLKACPVCLHIKEVGFEVAGKRLYQQYGADVLEVIEGNPLPKPEASKTSIDEDFQRVFKELNAKLQ